ncbi:MAG: MBOAT family O-acyltransferase [Ruminiclostridium sp.]
MLFTSHVFILFLVAVFILYYSIPKKYQWMLLLAASYLFYAFSGIKYILYILLTTVSTYFVSLKISELHQVQSDYLTQNKGTLTKEERKNYKAAIKSKQWKWLLLCFLINFGVLGVVKYTSFTIANINYFSQALGSDFKLTFWNIALPMGISFYTFQTMSYIIDVHRGKYPAERNPFKLGLFVSFFPQLVQGPISRFDDLSKTLFQKHSFDSRNISFGLQRILWGYFKKVVIADRILVGINSLIKDTDIYQGIFVLVVALFYAFELYADFTGGIDITIGIAEVFGIRVKENFERPFFSKSITEYWRRWHISMGTWFKDYLFYPVSVWKPMLELSKKARVKLGDALGKRVPVYISTIIVWFVTGIWHGASWNFIVWGLMNSVVILISFELSPFYEWFHKKFHINHIFAFRLFQVVRTVLLMSCIRLFDCYRDVPLTFKMFGTMFVNFNIRELFNGALMNIGLKMSDYIILMIGLVILTTVSLIQRSGSVREKLSQKPALVRYPIFYVLIITIIIFGAYGVGYDSSQFIYNQF